MKIANKQISKLQLLRLVVQILFFILIPGLYINTFSGIRQIYTGIINQNFNLVEYLPQMIEAIAVIPVTILLGRFFCGWMCAFGTFSDIIYHLSSKVFKVSFRINEKTDKVLKYFKFVLLGFLVVVVWSFGSINLSTANPWDVFGVLATIGKFPNISYAFSEFTVGFFILLAIIIASFFIERFFCRYLCPLGAVFAIISRLKFVKIIKPTDKCGACKVCTKSCAMGIPLYKHDKIDSGECINCLKCIPACPRKNVSISMAGTDVRPVIAGAMAVTLMTGIYYTGSFVTNAAGINTGSNLTAIASAQGASDSKYADGTYEGSGTGFRGATTTVSVTVENGTIKNIELISYGDDAKWFNRAYNSVVNQILSTQATDVDAVSGATYSSNGIMEAVEDALSNASISAQVALSNDAAAENSKSPSSDTSVNTAASTSSNTSTDKASDSLTASTMTTASSASSDSQNAIVSSRYSDGTYEGSARGFRRGITNVSVTVKKDKITDIEIVSNGDDARFFDAASSSVISEILDTQSADVDAVSGATYSSMGIMDAVADALINAEL